MNNSNLSTFSIISGAVLTVLFSLFLILPSYLLIINSFGMEQDFHLLAAYVSNDPVSPLKSAFLSFGEHMFQVALIGFSSVIFPVLAFPLYRRLPEGFAKPAMIFFGALNLLIVACIAFNPDTMAVSFHYSYKEPLPPVGLPWIYRLMAIGLSAYLLYNAYKYDDDEPTIGQSLIAFVMIVIAILLSYGAAYVGAMIGRVLVGLCDVAQYFDPMSMLENEIVQNPGTPTALRTVYRVKAFLPTFSGYLFGFYIGLPVIFFTTKWVKDRFSSYSLITMLILWSVSAVISAGFYAEGDLYRDFNAMAWAAAVGGVTSISGALYLYIRFLRGKQ